MRNKAMNRKESPIIRENLLGRLVNRQVFSWPGEKQSTIQEKINFYAQLEAKQKMLALNQALTSSPKTALQKVRPRAESWQFGELLDHTKPGQRYPLKGFWR